MTLNKSMLATTYSPEHKSTPRNCTKFLARCSVEHVCSGWSAPSLWSSLNVYPTSNYDVIRQSVLNQSTN